jgi:hypothetical protein
LAKVLPLLWLKLATRPDLNPVDWLCNQLLHTADPHRFSSSAALDLNSQEALLSLYGGKPK